MGRKKVAVAAEVEAERGIIEREMIEEVNRREEKD